MEKKSWIKNAVIMYGPKGLFPQKLEEKKKQQGGCSKEYYQVKSL